MIKFFSLIVLLALTALTPSLYAQPVRTDYVESELVSETRSIQPGTPFWIALRLKMDDEWHTYWRNPGDSGMPTTIVWTLPEGFSAGPIQWPYPQSVPLPPLVSYGYEGEVFLLTEITPPATLKSGQVIEIQAYASWLVCREICLPGEAGYALRLPVRSETPEPDERWTGAFARTRDTLPIVSADWKIEAALTDTTVLIHATPPDWFTGAFARFDFFPYSDSVIDHGVTAQFYRTASGYLLVMRRSAIRKDTPEAIEGVMVTPEGWRGPGSEKAMAVTAGVKASLPSALATGSLTTDQQAIGLLYALALAFAGGLILNLMPCVLPVLSIKILGFVHQAGENTGKSWHHGLSFTVGVLISFLLLAGALIALRAGGEQLGWGFQLQSPVFLILLSSFLFLFGLSLFGVFEIGTSLAGAGGKIDNRSGLSGSFISGVMATVVATPCTAPFMGPALGFALTQPPSSALLIFAFLGLGMSTPYLFLSSMPSLLRFVPKPGAWMVTFKQFMGFLMMATVVWLVWVLSLQTNPDLVAMTLGVYVLLGVGGWIVGRWGSLMATRPSRFAAWTAALALAVSGLSYTLSTVPSSAQTGARSSDASETGGLVWEPFSTQRLSALRAAGTPVFVDFTAAWCLSCQVNERVALNHPDVVRRFEELGLVALKADWTARDPEITTALAEFGRNSVPLYALYTGTADEPPTLLPEILTPGIVLDALKTLADGPTARQ